MTPILPDRPARRPRAIPQARLPKARDDWRPASILSMIVHLGIIILLIVPLTVQSDIVEREQGAGGPGPAGGGGGGRRGTGALQQELLRFVRVQPPAPTPAPPIPQPKLEIKPPVVPIPEPPKPVIQPPPVVAQAATMPVGVGGGTGNDTTGGSGSGTGGGVGTGVGTGRGSGVGAGTGGGNQENYPPSLIDLFIPPTPVPRSVSGARVVAEFDVDEKGKVLSVTFTQTKDRGYNRRLSDLFREFRFRPGTTPDGRAIRMKAQVAFDL